ncbi:hypothetical protein PsorP6_002932 [Peronosclerospora sorghi]|uniref:Uncharacterized protein n=1 Tax=Peronosclerospora sorghi TaxID=230839 RepID=A0ACC0VL73_9STRA|nr:hypothetical protein PsorP6_002932 [Peronosclerospora sorghi]
MRPSSLTLVALIARLDGVASSVESEILPANDATSFHDFDNNVQPVSPRRLRSDHTSTDEMDEARTNRLVSLVPKSQEWKKQDKIPEEVLKLVGIDTTIDTSQRVFRLIKALKHNDFKEVEKFWGDSLLKKLEQQFGAGNVATALIQAKSENTPVAKRLYEKQLQAWLKKQSNTPDAIFSSLEIAGTLPTDFFVERLSILDDYIRLYNKKKKKQIDLFTTVESGFERKEDLATSLAVAKEFTFWKDNKAASLQEQMLQRWVEHEKPHQIVTKILRLGKHAPSQQEITSGVPTPLSVKEGFTTAKLETLDKFIQLYTVKNPAKETTLLRELLKVLDQDKLTIVVAEMAKAAPKNKSVVKLRNNLFGYWKSTGQTPDRLMEGFKSVDKKQKESLKPLFELYEGKYDTIPVTPQASTARILSATCNVLSVRLTAVRSNCFLPVMFLLRGLVRSQTPAV